MPSFTLTFSYDSSDEGVIRTINQMVAAFGAGAGNSAATQNANPRTSGWADNVSDNFAGFIFETAARGEKSQKLVMERWLRADGVVALDELVRASGVKKTHDYAGVGSSLSRNMKKSGGPKPWYEKTRDARGQRIYKILPELVKPLRRAFKI